jgi:hypothetical protein
VQDDTILIRQLGCALVKGGAAEILQRYLERLAELGLDCSLAAPLIVDLEGEALSVERLLVHYETARTIRVAMEALRREGLVGERRILTTGGEESVVGGAAIDSFTGSGRDAPPLSGTAHTCRDHGRHKRPASSIIASTLSGCIKRLRIARYGWFLCRTPAPLFRLRASRRRNRGCWQ